MKGIGLAFHRDSFRIGFLGALVSSTLEPTKDPNVFTHTCIFEYEVLHGSGRMIEYNWEPSWTNKQLL